VIPNLVVVNYERTGRSTNTDALRMREMQARAFEARALIFWRWIRCIGRARTFLSASGRLESLPHKAVSQDSCSRAFFLSFE
jgi:hypothetical protein